MINFVGTARRVLALSPAESLAHQIAHELPADGMLIVVERTTASGAALRRGFADAGLEARASVIIGDASRVLYKIAGPFDLIVTNQNHPPGSPLRQSLDKLLAADGRLITPAGAALEAIAQRNSSLNAFVAVFNNAVESSADSDGPLRGLPISIKDLIDVAGTPTTAASRVRADHVAKHDAAVVDRLKRAGAVIIGKTNLHEFALGVTNDESAFGPARNPHDLTRSPGGSSGGSAAAVAAGLGWASIGTDTGGSIRIPSAACGVVGLKPSSGEIPTTGVFPLSVSLDHVGPIARSVSDAWTIYEVLRGLEPGPKEATSVSAIRLGRLTGYFLERLDPDVALRFAEAVSRLTAGGARISDVTVPGAPTIPATYSRIVLPEAFAVHARTLAEKREAYTADVAGRLSAGGEISREEYERAQGDRATFRRDVDALLEKYDVLVLPTIPIPAPTIGQSTVDLNGSPENVRALLLRETQLFNMTGHPAITIPCGTTAGGLPCGLQLVGKRNATMELLRISLGCEAYVNPDARAPAARRHP